MKKATWCERTLVVWRPLSVVLFAALLVGCSKKAPSDADVRTPTQIDLTAALAEGIVVTGSCGFAAKETRQENVFLKTVSTSKWGEWNIDIQIENRSARSLKLDNTIFIVESGPVDRKDHGAVIVKGERVRQPKIPPITVGKDKVIDYSESYRLDDYSAYNAHSVVADFGNGLKRFLFGETRKGFTPGKYGNLAPLARVSVKETVNVGSWFESSARSAVYLVLPEVHFGESANLDSYQPIACMEAREDRDQWTIREVSILHETPEILAATVASTTTPIFTRILAANRLAEYYPERAGEAFAATARGRVGSSVILCIIELAIRLETRALQKCCTRLVSDERIPEELRESSRRYIDMVTALPLQSAEPSAEAPGSTKSAPLVRIGTVVFEGGDGSSIEQAVLIKNAKNTDEGIDAEAKWIHKMHPGWSIGSQTLTFAIESGKAKRYDKIKCTTPNGEGKTVHFDITEFFGKR